MYEFAKRHRVYLLFDLKKKLRFHIYKRSNTTVTEVEGSHAEYISQPEKVDFLIIEATQAVSVGK